MKRIAKPFAAIAFGAAALLLSTTEARAAEGRIPISAPVTITVPGSYIVTEDITTAGTVITISVDHVSVDLDGHTLTSTGNTGPAVGNGTSNAKDIHVRNGKLAGGTYQVDFLANNGGEFSVEMVTATDADGSSNGIRLRGGVVAGTGVRASVRRNIISGPGNWGIELVNVDTATVEENQITGASTGGISITGAFNLFVIRNSVFYGDNGMQLVGCSNAQILDNDVTRNGGDGLTLSNSHNNRVERNNVSENSSGILLLAGSSRNSIVNNDVSTNGVSGIHLQTATRNRIRGNTASGNGTAVANPGIFLQGIGCTGNVIEENVLAGNSNLGLRIDTGIRNVYSRNRTVENTGGSRFIATGNFSVGDNYAGETGSAF